MPRARFISPVRVLLLLVALVVLLYVGSLWRVDKPAPPSAPVALAVPSSDVEIQVLN